LISATRANAAASGSATSGAGCGQACASELLGCNCNPAAFCETALFALGEGTTVDAGPDPGAGDMGVANNECGRELLPLCDEARVHVLPVLCV